MDGDREIRTIGDIVRRIGQGLVDWRPFGDVGTRTYGDLLLFFATDKARDRNRWNFFERVSRGLIINKSTGEVESWFVRGLLDTLIISWLMGQFCPWPG